MIKTTTIFIVLALAAVASAQLIYSSVQVGVEAATPCPPDWTRTNETGTLEVQAVTTTDRFYCSLLP